MNINAKTKETIVESLLELTGVEYCTLQEIIAVLITLVDDFEEAVCNEEAQENTMNAKEYLRLAINQIDIAEKIG